jgi:hypothetical protein
MHISPSQRRWLRALAQEADGELLQVQRAGYERWRVNAAGTRVTYDAHAACLG